MTEVMTGTTEVTGMTGTTAGIENPMNEDRASAGKRTV
jgi:hypothetical protein